MEEYNQNQLQINELHRQMKALVKKQRKLKKQLTEEEEEALINHVEARQRGALRKYTFPIRNDVVDVDDAFNDVNGKLKGALRKELKQGMFKYRVYLNTRMRRLVEGGETIERKVYFGIKIPFPDTLYNPDEINGSIEMFKDRIKEELDAFVQYGSGWQIMDMENVELSIYKVKNKRGRQYIPTPSELRGVINVRNEDNECFKWCMLYHQTEQEKNMDKLGHLKKVVDKFNWEGIKFPCSLSEIRKFEELNDIGITVFEYRGKDKNPEIIQKGLKKSDKAFILLLEQDDKSHYLYIKDIGKMFKISKSRTSFYCDNCHKPVTKLAWERGHYDLCCKFMQEGTQIELPEEGTTMQFKNFKGMLHRPFVIYADFECSLKDTGDVNKTQKHYVNSYAFKVVSRYGLEEEEFKLYRGSDAGSHFFRTMLKLTDRLMKLQKMVKPMIITDEEEKQHRVCNICWICGGEIAKKGDKVRDHCHYTGLFRGTAHYGCNVNFKLEDYIPIVFHNLRGYDGHILMSEAVQYGFDNISAIPNNYEKFMMMKIGNMKFIDSMQFMNESLDKLSKNLITDDFSNFANVGKFFNKDEMKIMCRKGFYPYDYVNNNKVFKKPLPSRDKFYNKLCQEELTVDDYDHVINVYQTMKCNNFGDYHDLYLKCDVLLLADVFENFRNLCINVYKLDPSNYMTSPSLSWDAMLMTTKIKLELISDYEILEFMEKWKRGGLCFVGSRRHVVANNKYLSDYDKTKKSSFISYLDANNLYGWAMRESLPYAGLKWSDAKYKDVMKSDDGDIGYALEVDLSFPDDVKDLLKQYVPCPETISIKDEWLSDYQKDVLKLNGQNHNKCDKLVPHFYKHEKYVIHVRNLQKVVSLGVKVDKVHRILEFKQKPWLKEYIDKNTLLRSKAKNGFEKDFFKLMNNSVFGKTMENLRGRIDLKYLTDDEKAMKWQGKMNFKNSMYHNGLYTVEMSKLKLVYDKPLYVGCSALDLSKLLMMNFHYDYMVEKYPKCEVIYSDTDSLVYYVKTRDLYRDMVENKEHFDLSDMVEKFRDDGNKKVVGKFKDETCGVPIKEFVALKPKVYSFLCDGHSSKKAKGVNKSTVKKDIKHDHYVKCLKSGKQQYDKTTGIRSFNHEIFTYQNIKISLSAFDDKYHLIDSIHGVPHGY